MKMRADRIEGQNAIARHGPEGVLVNGVEHTRSVIVPWRGDVAEWDAATFDALTPEHFARIAALVVGTAIALSVATWPSLAPFVVGTVTAAVALGPAVAVIGAVGWLASGALARWVPSSRSA